MKLWRAHKKPPPELRAVATDGDFPHARRRGIRVACCTTTTCCMTIVLGGGGLLAGGIYGFRSAMRTNREQIEAPQPASFGQVVFFYALAYGAAGLILGVFVARTFVGLFGISTGTMGSALTFLAGGLALGAAVAVLAGRRPQKAPNRPTVSAGRTVFRVCFFGGIGLLIGAFFGGLLDMSLL